jgi:hypothetical protein
MVWPAVGADYNELFASVVADSRADAGAEGRHLVGAGA